MRQDRVWAPGAARRRARKCVGARVRAALLSALAVGACGLEADSAPGWEGTVDTLASGTIVVQNGDARVWSDAEAWRLSEEVRIGSAMGEGPEMLGRVTALLSDEAGRIYVLEGHAQEVRVFNADGSYSHTIGGEGEGPGELKQVAAMGWGAGGQLRVVDLGNARITEYSKEGEFLRDERQPGGFSIVPWPGAVVDDGSLITVAPRIVEGSFRPVLVRHDPDMVVVDSLEIPRYEGPANNFSLRDEDGGGITAGVPYSPGLRWDLDPDGSYWVVPNTAEYRIHRISFSGDTLLTIEKAWERAPVSGAEADSAIASMKWFTDQGGEVDRARVPGTKPSVSRLFFTGSDHLIVVPITADFASGWGAPPSVVHVFGPDGRFLGPMQLPEGMRLAGPEPQWSDETVLAVVQDELDVPYVVRFQLQSGPPGS